MKRNNIILVLCNNILVLLMLWSKMSDGSSTLTIVSGANPWYGYIRLTNHYFHDGRKACWARGDVTHFCLDNNWETNKDMSVNRERQFNSDSFSDNGKDPESGTTFPLDPFTTGRVWWCLSRSMLGSSRTVRPRPRYPPPPTRTCWIDLPLLP